MGLLAVGGWRPPLVIVPVTAMGLAPWGPSVTPWPGQAGQRHVGVSVDRGIGWSLMVECRWG
ncbi:MAG: hypothetical protein QOJ30_3712, partial [Pseudonocardiales bacterium]|nr:hypothetical protein [Pseudonocardiales bacterium]